MIGHRLTERTSPSRFSSRERTRTQTTPQKSSTSQPMKSRRFSLSAPQRGSKLDFLKSTIIPHPPLPQSFLEAQQTSSRRESNETGSATNIDGHLSATNNHNVNADEHVFGGPSCISRTCVGTSAGRNQEQYIEKGRRVSSEGVRVAQTGFSEHVYGESLDHERTPRRPTVHTRIRTKEGETNVEDYDGSPRTPKTPQRTRRSRGFSLSSAISSRALKAKSIILGRPSGQDTEPRLPGYLSPEVSTQHREPILREEAISPVGSSVGCADYEPDLVLDNISFAHTRTSGVASSAVSSAQSEALARNLSEPTGGVHIIVTEGIEGDESVTYATGEEMEDEADETARIEAREEERGFMRALGLEFDEIARRVTTD